ncbi:MAG TPA: NAD(+) synthase [Bryobacteraceae bacterium]|nr:NAD(+) synthase [Bryobacteraceae bacterium]
MIDGIFSRASLDIDARRAAADIEEWIRKTVLDRFRRRGAVVGLSGGIDSSVTAALCVRALGAKHVFGLLMPEDESSDDSSRLASILAESLGLETAVEHIGKVLDAIGCYERRDRAIRRVIPEYGAGWKSKIVLPGIAEGAYYPLYSVVAQSPLGAVRRARLSPEAYCEVVAATNFKQRIRKTLEYYHADRLWYAVAGTPNRLEYAQGFFVKNGDGSADFKPIAHLYKTQVYALGQYLGVPEEILRRPPTTDTYSLEQSQEEFYFNLPYEQMDLCMYARNNCIPAKQAGSLLSMTNDQVSRAYTMIDAKLRSTRYLHMHGQVMEPIPEIIA